MRIRLLFFFWLLGLLQPGEMSQAAEEEDASASSDKTVFILPIRENIMPPLVYVVRRGVKTAIEAEADLLVLDMDTNGGRVDTTEEVIGILDQFPGKIVTFVNRKAFSAGAFIAFATSEVYMAPKSVIGAAAPIMMGPAGSGAEMSDTMEVKMTSGISALVRANAQENGYDMQVVNAMIDKSKELRIGDEVLCEKGQILTLTNVEAEKEYGDPSKHLLSSGTVESLEVLLKDLEYGEADRTTIEPTGVENFATWINAISPVLLLIGIVGIYIEFKTPGFGLPGIVGLAAFAIYFLGGYVAGLSGVEWAALFVLGVVLCVLELFLFPGTAILGLTGAALMLASIIMAMVDIYPGLPGLPIGVSVRVPLEQMLLNLTVAVVGSLVAIVILSRLLPKTRLYDLMVSGSASGEAALTIQDVEQAKMKGDLGVTLSVLRPSGKAQFGDSVLDVISQGEMILKDSRIRIVGYSGAAAIVEAA